MKFNKILSLIIASLWLCTVQAQKVVEKTLLKPGTTLIQVDAENCFTLLVQNSDSREVIIEAQMDGEYNKDLLIRAEENGQTLDISAGFRPNFVKPNDKLSAHKVVSISMTISIPKNSNLKVTGTSSTVALQGEYRDVDVILSDGRCMMHHKAENTAVTTQSGNIYLTSPAATITATSAYGKVFLDGIPKGDPIITLLTTTGDIRLKRVQ